VAAKGHEDQFLPPKLSARSVIRKQTVAATRGNGRDAPIPDLRAINSGTGRCDPKRPRAGSRLTSFLTVSRITLNCRGTRLSVGSAGHVRGGDRLPGSVAMTRNFASLSSMIWQVLSMAGASSRRRIPALSS
jgi:hypothetical protein